MKESRRIFYITLCSEVISEVLISMFTQHFICIELCDLGCQTLRKVTLFLAKQHTLMDRIDVLIY
jgi:hypothetical protein